MKKLIILVPQVLLGLTIFAQENILENYIEEGLESNLALQEKYNSYQKSILALEEAKGLFMPDISFNLRYSVTQGGRTIELPIGDLMNPVYSTLNGITGAMALSGQIPPTSIFPDTSINNEQINFLRPTEHETKLRMVQPLINTQIWNNYKIKKEFINIEKADAETYKRYLVAEIKTAYFNYLSTEKIIELLNNTQKLVNENYRVNQKLYENDKITYDIVLRSKAEIDKLQQQIAEANKNQKVARSYFNFLLNKPLNQEIIPSDWDTVLTANLDIDYAYQQALNNREELQAMKSYLTISGRTINLNKSDKLPSVTAVVDYGLQGAKYEFDNLDDQDYLIASVILKWDLFKGFQNNSKIQQSEIDLKIMEDKQRELTDHINLQVTRAFYDAEAAFKAIISAQSETENLKLAF